MGVPWVMPISVLGLLESWRRWSGGSSMGTIWKAILLNLMWGIWREHNAHCFDDRETSIAKLKYLVLNTLYEWTPPFATFSDEGLLDFLDFFCTLASSFAFWKFVSPILFLLLYTFVFFKYRSCVLGLHFFSK